jgi:hypothetical protein
MDVEINVFEFPGQISVSAVVYQMSHIKMYWAINILSIKIQILVDRCCRVK